MSEKEPKKTVIDKKKNDELVAYFAETVAAYREELQEIRKKTVQSLFFGDGKPPELKDD